MDLDEIWHIDDGLVEHTGYLILIFVTPRGWKHSRKLILDKLFNHLYSAPKLLLMKMIIIALL